MAARAGTLAAAAAASGCALPLPFGDRRDVVFGMTSISASGRSARRVVPGFDIRANGPTAGATLGWSDVRAVVEGEGDANGDAPASSGFVPPFGWAWTDDDGTRHAIGLTLFRWPDAPGVVFRHEIAFGVGGRATSGDGGVFAGFMSGGIVVVPPSDEGAYVLLYDSANPAGARFETINAGRQDHAGK